MSDTPETVDPLLLSMWNEAQALVSRAAESLTRAQGAEVFVRTTMVKQYQLGKRDSVDGDTGVITRATLEVPKEKVDA